MTEKITELTSHIQGAEITNSSVSTASIGWHIHHSLGVVNGVCLALIRSKDEDYQGRFNLKKSLFFLLGKFPRGKAQAPNKNKQANEITEEDINKQLNNAHKLLAKIDGLSAKSHFKHPIFGQLNLKESKKFLIIHTEHHLKIIRDILK